MEKKIKKYHPCIHEDLSLGKETSMQDIIPQHDKPNDGILSSTKQGLPGIRNAFLGGPCLSPNLEDDQGLVKNGEEKVPDHENNG